ncbi:MAG: hypothetical protein SGARI_000634 [Bacillariaceae sp.]
MATATLISDFSVKAFNDVADYDDVRAFGEKDKNLPSLKPTIDAFGALFADCKKNEHANLSLIHRHFLLKDGEKKVAWQDEENQILIIKATQASEYAGNGQKLLPYLFQVVEKEDGKPTLVPLEFALHSNEDRYELLEAQIEAISDEAFLAKFLKLTQELEGGNLFGILLPARDFLIPNECKSRSTIEVAGDGDRTLIVKPFKRGDGERKPDGCCSCWHCTHCEHYGEENTNASGPDCNLGGNQPDFSGPGCTNCEVTTVAWKFSDEGKAEDGPCCCHCTHCHHCHWMNH